MTSPIPPMITDKSSWGYLPREIRLSILETVIQDGSCSLAGLATVSREWQTTIERHNFSRIRLTPSRLARFGSMTWRNRALVRYIWVCLELRNDICGVCNILYGYEYGNRRTDEIDIVTALYQLFSALESWEPQGDLLLDISLYAPGDSEHYFKELTFVPDIPSAEECEGALCGTMKAALARFNDDQEHGWNIPTRPPLWPMFLLFRDVMGNGWLEDLESEITWRRRLPSAPAVTGLLFRQQNRRRWNPAEVSRLLWRLPGVREIYYEPWREFNEPTQRYMDDGFRFAFDHSYHPANLERVVLFENYDPRVITPHTKVVRIVNPALSMAVAGASRRLKHLSVAFAVDASDFFLGAARKPSWEWPNLTTLALTSRLLVPSSDPEAINRMLIAAAAAAMRMPALETVGIWNGGVGSAGLFRFRSALRGRTAGVSWRGTWRLGLADGVLRAWGAVADRERRAGLSVATEEELLDASKIRFHGDAIYYLGLESQVIRPVSLYQMRKERDIREGTSSQY